MCYRVCRHVNFEMYPYIVICYFKYLNSTSVAHKFANIQQQYCKFLVLFKFIFNVKPEVRLHCKEMGQTI